MGTLLRLLAANALILGSVHFGRRHPSLGGLLATMPLTTLIVLLWLSSEAPGDYPKMVSYTRGVLWGILPSVGFFLTALFLFGRRAPLGLVLLASFAVWLAGAFVHRSFVGG